MEEISEFTRIMTEKKKILCVDDDEDDRDFLCDAVRELDPEIEVIHAPNGLVAYTILSNTQTSNFPCLIIMYINMPVMNGKEALAQIKNNQVFKDIPLIMFSTSSHYIDCEFCRQYNVQLVTKSSDMTIIKKEVKKLLSNCV